jgi:tRNA U55 pseudouridine synthase TruB
VTVTMLAEAEAVERAEVLAAMQALTGSIEQVPPMYSALKKDGRRLHELARAGVVVEREARSIQVHHFRLLSFDKRRGRFSVAATKGTYVRSLVFDMGRSLGCGAHLTELRRTRSGSFGLEQAITLAELQSGECEIRLVDPAAAVSHLPQVLTPEELVSAVGDGKRLPWQLFSEGEVPSDVFALLTPTGDGLLAIAGVEEEKLRYRRVFNYALTRTR